MTYQLLLLPLLHRIRFLLESLHDLDNQLRQYGTNLYVVKGHPLASLEKVCNQWNVQKLVFQADREVRSHIVEDVVERLAHTLSLEVGYCYLYCCSLVPMCHVSFPSCNYMHAGK